MTLQSKFIVAIATAMMTVLLFGVWFLDTNSRQDRLELLQREVGIILGLAKSSRHYVKSVLRPALNESTDHFILEGGSSTFVTHGIFKFFNQGNPGFSYRQPTLNPLNDDHIPTQFEYGLIKRFQNSVQLTELSGFVKIDDKEKYYFAKPVFVEEECLSCHGDPKQAPREIVARYGSEHGFGWQLDHLVGLTIVTIPIEGAIKSIADGRRSTLILFAALFLCVPVLAQFLFQYVIGRRLSDSGKLMLEIAMKPSTGKRFVVSGDDEVGQMESAFNRVVDAFQETQLALSNRLQQLVDEENRFRSLAYSASDGFISADRYQRILSWNQGASEIFGYSEDEMVGSSIQRLIPQRYLNAHEKRFGRILSEGGKGLDRKPKEAMGIHKLGHEIPIEISLSSWVTGGKRNFSAIVRDTTERLRAKEKSQRELLSRIAINTMLEVGLMGLTLNEKLEKVLQVTLAVHWLSIQYKGCIFLMNEKTGKLEMAVQHGLGEEILGLCKQVDVGSCLCGQAAATKKIVFASEVDHRHEIKFEGMQPHGHYCIPITYEDRLLGVLNLYLKVGKGGGRDEERFIKTVAHTLAGIIEREYAARSLRQLSKATEESPASVVITNPKGFIEYVRVLKQSLNTE
jgi:PAS domain S-box-containing protein